MMFSTQKDVVVFVTLIVIYITGIFLFTKGFLLTRLVVNENSTCHVDFAGHMDHHGYIDGKSGCWMLPHFKKTVFVVIDALRFDFVAFNSTARSSGNSLPYQNKLKSLHRILKMQPRNSRLYRFIADPPTTTLQRLKGLTTGSLPTFVDAGYNFASSDIVEDNIIDQFVKQGKKITFMGDDTWLALFPNRFKRSYAYPSLNVKDLHTVDDGVMSHLMPEMNKSDWDVIIAHFLGVDHCGHRYGPNHHAMSEKLTQMDAVLSSLIKALDNNTLLVVLGDHGMTRSGDHGGDSRDELEAALFMYSPSLITSSPPQNGDYEQVSQVDLVPTLSLLLGIPIPFSNLGSVIEDLFNHSPSWTQSGSQVRQLYHTLSALHLNAHQINDYIMTYSKISEDFPQRKLRKWDDVFSKIERDLQRVVESIHLGEGAVHVESQLKELKDKYLEYLTGIKTMCQSVWAKFDLNGIVLGLTITTTAVLLNAFLIYDLRWSSGYNYGWAMAVSGWIVALCMFLYLCEMKFKFLISSLIMGILTIGLITFILYKILQSQNSDGQSKRVSGYMSFVEVVSIGCLFMYCMSLFSNSYVVNEDIVTAYLFHSLLLCHVYQVGTSLYRRTTAKMLFSIPKKNKQSLFDEGRHLKNLAMMLIFLAILASLCVRMSANFRACREEKISCDVQSFLQPFSDLVDDTAQSRHMRYFLSVVSVIAVPLSLRYWLQFHGNLNGYAPSVLYVLYGLPITAFAVLFYWALQGLPLKVYENLPVWQLVLFPRIVYLLSLFSIAICIVKPLTIFVFTSDNKTSNNFFLYPAGNNVIPQVFKHLTENWKKHFKSQIAGHSSTRADEDEKSTDTQVPVVYGLATVYSSSLLILLASITMILFITLGDGMAASLTLQIAGMFFLLELVTCSTKLRSADGCIPLSSVVLWSLFACEHFFASGHQTTVTSIRWEAAYHGFHGDFENYTVPAALIIANTFASYILSTVALPLLLFWLHNRGNSIYTTENYKILEEKGEFELHEDQSTFRRSMGRLILAHILIFGVRLLAAMCCAGLHRRHLMVWKIFAPRYVYEVAAFLLVTLLSCFMHLFVLRVDISVKKWKQTLN